MLSPQHKITFTKSDCEFFSFDEGICISLVKTSVKKYLNENEIIDVEATKAEKCRTTLLDIEPSSAESGTSLSFEYIWSQSVSFVYSPVANKSIQQHWSVEPQNAFTDLIQTVLACVPSSASVERLLSVAGSLKTAKRNRLGASNLSNFFIIKNNQNTC